jgi:hypothetical protein
MHELYDMQRDSLWAPAHGGAKAYRSKAPDYFAGARGDYVSELPVNPKAKILEIGCGQGT